jgi:predicted nucleotidyltransferase
MKHEKFVQLVIDKIKTDRNVIGLAVAGSYITNEIDEFSDVDLVMVTAERIPPDVDKMVSYAKSFGDYLNGFTGEHVGDPRVLICLYDNPLLHVDIKFVTIDELRHRVEDPVIVFDRDGALQEVIATTKAEWPGLDYQWIEDRFWTWVHYAALKLGRGENFEALDFLSYVRVTVTAPLLQIRNGNLPRGLRRVEFNFNKQDLAGLVDTVPRYDRVSIFNALYNTISLYQGLRRSVFPRGIQFQRETENKTLRFLNDVRNRVSA